jgi:predicted nucleotidyltransferase
MKLIVQIKFGSHLYGTSTPQSDLDIKGVYLPCARDILLQQVKSMFSESRPKAHGEKNTSDDIDREAYSLQRYMELLAQGQTVALDMLFAPDWAMIKPPDQVWSEVQELAPQIITKGATAFVKYCRQQANKYGIKGSRVAASRIALDVLKQAEEKYGAQEKLEHIYDDLKQVVASNEFLKFSEGMQPNGDSIMYFEICGKKIMLTASIKVARELAQKLVNEYGQRALAAERNEGVDWKALSHAVRVGHEALELFSTKHITFPRPEAQHLLAIKRGQIDYKQVAEEIEQLLVDVEDSAVKSDLLDSADQSIIDDFVIGHYTKQVIAG